MNAKSPETGTEHDSAENLSDEELKELELAGGVEGGMKAGNAGGPSQSDVEQKPLSESAKRRDR